MLVYLPPRLSLPDDIRYNAFLYMTTLCNAQNVFDVCLPLRYHHAHVTIESRRERAS